MNSYDLVLLLGPDVAFVQDGDRSEVIAADREKYTGILQCLCEQHSLSVVRIDGDYQDRYEKAVNLINALLKGDTNA